MFSITTIYVIWYRLFVANFVSHDVICTHCSILCSVVHPDVDTKSQFGLLSTPACSKVTGRAAKVDCLQGAVAGMQVLTGIS